MIISFNLVIHDLTADENQLNKISRRLFVGLSYACFICDVGITAGAGTCGRDANTSTASGRCKIGIAQTAGENPFAGQ
jgi:hypothetical protein